MLEASDLCSLEILVCAMPRIEDSMFFSVADSGVVSFLDAAKRQENTSCNYGFRV